MYALGQAITFETKFIDIRSGSGFAGITVTVNVYAPDGTLIVSAGSPIDRGQGIYCYVLSGSSNTQSGEWIAVFTTTTEFADFKDLFDRQRVIPASYATLIADANTLNADILIIKDKTDDLLSDTADIHNNIAEFMDNFSTHAIILQVYLMGTTIPIADVAAAIHNAANEMVGYHISSVNGQCVFYLSDGIYTIHLHKSGVVFDDELLTVTTDESKIMYGNILSL